MAILTGHEQRVLSEATAFILDELELTDIKLFDSMTKHTGVLLITPVSSSITTLVVSGDNFKSSLPFIIRIDDEAMLVTSMVVTPKASWDSSWGKSYTLTVTRGYGSTTVTTHTDCSDVYLVVLDGSIVNLRGDTRDSMDITFAIFSAAMFDAKLSGKRVKEYNAVKTYYTTKSEVTL